MVKGEREGHHRAHDYGSLLHDGFFLNSAKRENGHFRMIDDGRATAAAKAAHVVQGKGAAAHFRQR